MKALLFTLLTVISVLGIISCCTHDFEYEVSPQDLSGVWIHAHEEGSHEKSLTFRPVDFQEFSQMDLRNRLEIKADGRATYLIESLNDPYKGTLDYYIRGTWSYDDWSRHLYIRDTDGAIRYAFEVRELTSDKLRISYTEVPEEVLPK